MENLSHEGLYTCICHLEMVIFHGYVKPVGNLYVFFLTGIFYVLRSLSVCGITFSRNTTLHMGSIESKHARTPYIYVNIIRHHSAISTQESRITHNILCDFSSTRLKTVDSQILEVCLLGLEDGWTCFLAGWSLNGSRLNQHKFYAQCQCHFLPSMR